ncbi:MAG: hypothetical protein PVJ57_02545 [Phycisphaerae bacterium]
MALLHPGPVRPRDVAQRLKLDKSLAWKVARIAQARDPRDVMEYVPGSGGIEIVLSAAESAGVGREVIDSARQAFQDFERMIGQQASDRATLELMIRGMGGPGEPVVDETQRKLLYHGSRAVWGTHTRVHIKADFLAPSQRAGFFDLAVLSGFVDFERLRPGVLWAFARKRVTDDEGCAHGYMKVESLDPAFPVAGGVPLLGDFCSAPARELRPFFGPDGSTNYAIPEGPIGLSGTVTCMTGVISRELASYYRTADNTFGEHLLELRTPAELMLFDLFVHKDLPLCLPPAFAVYGELWSWPSTPASRAAMGALPITAAVEYLGSGPPTVDIVEVPRYREMVDQVFARAGWEARDFRAYRVRMTYPPIPAMAVLHFELPEPPAPAKTSGRRT